MSLTMPSCVRSSVPKIAVAGALIAIPTLGIASNALAPSGIHPAPPLAAPAIDTPEPPAPAPMPVQAPADYDWSSYAGGTGGGGGGG